VDLDYARLAAAVVAAREARGWTQKDLASSSGLGITTIQRIEDEHATTRPTPRTLKAIDRALDRDEGYLEGVLRGTKPTPASETPRPPHSSQKTDTADTDAIISSLPVRVRRILETGELFDADVITIRDLDVIFIAKAGVYTAEEITRKLEEHDEDWDAVREALRDIKQRTDQPPTGHSDE
jgi:transcriptional regulator with XRE-family HTH domain